MKTIGLLGGMSWQSTALYYQLINEETSKALGGLHSAKIAMVSVDFHEVELLQQRGDWDAAGQVLAQAAQQVESAGADLLLICTNTMHKVADSVQNAIDIPLLHLADATASRVLAAGVTNVGLLGTRFTMEQDFYKQRLIDKGLNVVMPAANDRTIVHDIIYNELCVGYIREESRLQYLRIIDEMEKDGVQGVIQGCTEIVLLVQQKHTGVRLFDTTAIHAQAAVAQALL